MSTRIHIELLLEGKEEWLRKQWGGPDSKLSKTIRSRRRDDDNLYDFWVELADLDELGVDGRERGLEPGYTENRAELLIDFLKDVAPVKYIDRALRWYMDDEQWKIEDIHLLGKDLTLLSDLQRRRIIQGYDINRSRYGELKGLLSQHEDAESKRQEEKGAVAQLYKSGEAKLIHEDDSWKIVQLYSKAAACELGKGTRWCTAGENHNMYHSYASKGPLYVIFDKANKRKLQLWFEKKTHWEDETEGVIPWAAEGIQFMDEADEPVAEEREILAEIEDFVPAIKQRNDGAPIWVYDAAIAALYAPDRGNLSNGKYHALLSDDEKKVLANAYNSLSKEEGFTEGIGDEIEMSADDFDIGRMIPLYVHLVLNGQRRHHIVPLNSIDGADDPLTSLRAKRKEDLPQERLDGLLRLIELSEEHGMSEESIAALKAAYPIVKKHSDVIDLIAQGDKATVAKYSKGAPE